MAAAPPKKVSIFRKGDEVATEFLGRLYFGTLDHPVEQNPGEWSVRWNDDIWSQAVPKRMNENELVLTDRAIYRGCKVRRADKSSSLTGLCRAVRISAAVRVVGTTTILGLVDTNDLTHLKEFKHKSVVCDRGWLGVITDVERVATIRSYNGTVSKIRLGHSNFNSNLNLRASGLTVESPWVNEGLVCNAQTLKKAKLESNANADSIEEGADADASSTDQQTKAAQQRVYIEDIQVISATVAWRFQLDLMSPDQPPSTYKDNRLKSLKMIREDFCSESTFHVGNLCRFKIKNDSEFTSLADFQRSRVLEYFPGRVDELNPNVTSNRAYDKDPESRLLPGKVCVVEIVHLTGTGDIIWQDGTYEFMKSTDLVVQEESLIDSVLIPGDFIFSREIRQRPDDAYAVIQRTDLQRKEVFVKLFSCTSPPKVIDAHICLKEKNVIPHQRYKYFNESNTIAVTSSSKGIRVGHVQGTNLGGKVSILFIDTGKEEWIWPAECSVFSVKGYDLECIINLIISDDEVSQDPVVKIQIITNRLKEINNLWQSPKDSDAEYLAQTVRKLKNLISELVSIEGSVGTKGQFFSPENISDSRAQRMTSLLAEYLTRSNSDGDGDSAYGSGDFTELVKLMLSCSSQLIGECSNALQQLSPAAPENNSSPSTSTPMEASTNDLNPIPMEVDDSAIETDSNPSPSGLIVVEEFQDYRSSALAEFPDCFIPNVVVEETHPEGHLYAKSQFEQEHARYFMKIVRDELNNLRDSCPPGIKIKAYGNRFDLFSIMICGPKHTPYENSLYFFDAALPTSYPAIPPKFHFHSYGAGRLNPNLYAEGRVCVSLLGTWPGEKKEQWTKESNMAQVLLSIQALILVNEPYHNEPGLEADKSDPKGNWTKCLNYNVPLMPKVAQMMVNQIKMPMEPWKEEISAFYKENIPKFIDRWKKWLKVTDLKSMNEDEKPGFAILPASNSLKNSLNPFLKTLEELHKWIPDAVVAADDDAGPSVSVD